MSLNYFLDKKYLYMYMLYKSTMILLQTSQSDRLLNPPFLTFSTVIQFSQRKTIQRKEILGKFIAKF